MASKWSFCCVLSLSLSTVLITTSLSDSVGSVCCGRVLSNVNLGDTRLHELDAITENISESELGETVVINNMKRWLYL